MQNGGLYVTMQAPAAGSLFCLKESVPVGFGAGMLSTSDKGQMIGSRTPFLQPT